MYPTNDICNLLQTPFNQWNNEDKKDVFHLGRPTDSLAIVDKKEKSGKCHNINF